MGKKDKETAASRPGEDTTLSGKKASKKADKAGKAGSSITETEPKGAGKNAKNAKNKDPEKESKKGSKKKDGKEDSKKSKKKAAKKTVEAQAKVEAAVEALQTTVEDLTVDAASFEAALRVREGFRLSDVDTSGTPAFDGDKAAAEVLMEQNAEELSELQERLFAASRAGDNRSVLLVIQGLDTSGKGGIMRHVVGQLDPQGVSIVAFKQPTAEEKRHPFLWRIRKGLPTPGIIGVFDRSHYEDVLVARVDDLVPASTWRRRYSQIRTFENSVIASGTTVIKVMLHIGADEQKARLGERLERADKYWKYNPGDIDVREKWPAYQEAYEDALVKTSTDDAPWYVVPADRKWYARLAVQQLLLKALRELDPQWPAADFDIDTEKARLEAS